MVALHGTRTSDLYFGRASLPQPVLSGNTTTIPQPTAFTVIAPPGKDRLCCSGFVPFTHTRGHASEEARLHHAHQTQPTFKEVFIQTSYSNPTLFSVSQAGIVNNLNNGMAWELFPVFFAAHGFGVESIAILVVHSWESGQRLSIIRCWLLSATWFILYGVQ